MNKDKYLSHIKVLDFSSKLPGPLASYKLAKLGAQVTKLELVEDSFFLEPSFKKWYQALNKNKKITKKININDFDIVIALDNKYCNEVIKKLNVQTIIYLKGSKSGSPLHDINIWAKHLSLSELPFLPFAGICFGLEIANVSVASLQTSEKKVINMYLDECVDDLFKMLPKSKDPSLHDGKYPCYCIYELKDGKKVAFAAVEQHFWDKFIEITKIKLLVNDRFDTTGVVFNSLKEYFKNIYSQDFINIIAKENICVTLMKD